MKGFEVKNITHCWTKKSHVEGDMFKHKTIVHITVLRGNKKNSIYFGYEVNDAGILKMIVVNSHGFMSFKGDHSELLSAKNVFLDFPHVTQKYPLYGDVHKLYEYLCTEFKAEFLWNIDKCPSIIKIPSTIDSTAFDYIDMLGSTYNVDLETMKILW